MRPVRLRDFVIGSTAVLTFAMPAAGRAQQHAKSSFPAHVLIIRHAEKPPESAKSTDLAPAGQARAKALPQLFAAPSRPGAFPRPDFIFASRDTKMSHRPRLTAEPLGAALGEPVDTRFADHQVKKIARELLEDRKYAGKTVLIVWHQGSIPDLARELGATDAPKSWKDSVFDRVWEISYDERGHVTFSDRPQSLSLR